MRNVKRQTTRLSEIESCSNTIEAGGPIAAMHARINERLAAPYQESVDLAAYPPPSIDERIVQFVSRSAGPLLLLLCCVGLAARFIG